MRELEIDSWDNARIAADPVVMVASCLFGTSEGNGNLTECGLFVNSSGAAMFSRGLFGYGAISNATQANPVVITGTAHGLSDGDRVFVEGVGGMTEINDTAFYVDKLTDDTFALYSDSSLATPVDGTAFGAHHERRHVEDDHHQDVVGDSHRHLQPDVPGGAKRGGFSVKSDCRSE